ncbi:PepSY domain-containing protein [Thalassotalea ganghwensis]
MRNKVRKYHKWLMAFIGIQFLFWSITGVYMVSMDIHYIHGESLATDEQAKVDVTSLSYSFADLLANYPKAKGITLSQRLGVPVYTFIDSENGKVVIDANTGLVQPLIDETRAKEIANFYYSHAHGIDSVSLISAVSELPAELSPRHLPVWRVTFDSYITPTFYISQHTGSLVAKRHDYWRLFDWMWRFHIMDYDDGENIANWLLLLVASLALLAALSGAMLTYFRVISPKKRKVM